MVKSKEKGGKTMQKRVLSYQKTIINYYNLQKNPLRDLNPARQGDSRVL